MSFHHFIGSGLNRSEKIQALVVELLLSSKLPQSKRESSVLWELKHSSGVVQLARLLAQKRNVNEELAIVAAALHDVYVILEGGYTDHAKNGEKIARNILIEKGDFTENEIDQICNAIANHSDKHIYGDDKLVELIKDADCVDCFFYGDTVYDDKPPEKLRHYYKRIINVRQELGLPPKNHFKGDTKTEEKI
ncbi:MAG: HD domain-containing protein [Candidatus Micrarchaeota archaeon]